MITEKEIVSKLSEKGYRITKTRIDIIKCLFDDSHSHTMNELVNHLSQKNKKINVSSAYNTIQILINEGFVDHRTDYKNKAISYEIVNQNDNHIHIYDFDNKKEYNLELPNSISKKIENLIKDKLNLKMYNLKVEVQVKNNSRRKNEKI